MNLSIADSANRAHATSFLWAASAIGTGLLFAIIDLPPLLLLIAGGGLLLLGAIAPFAPLIALAILSPLRTLIATEAAFQLPLDIGQLVLLVFIGVWLIHYVAIERRFPQVTGSPVHLAVLILLATTALSLFNAESVSAWLREWLKWIQALLLIVVIGPMLRHRPHGWHWIIWGLVLAGVANALVGIYQFFGGSGALHLLVGDRFFRAFGTFGQPNPFGGFMGLITPLSLMLALGYGFRWLQGDRRWLTGAGLAFYAIGAGLMCLALIMSWSRGAWLGFGAALAVMAFALPRRVIYGSGLSILIALVVGFLWLTNLLPASITARLGSATEEFFAFEDVRGVDITPANYAVVERLSHWQAAISMAQSSPWIGVGFGNYEVAYAQHRLLNWREPLGHAHNYYLNILAETGIIGLLGYLKALVLIIGVSWRIRLHPDPLARLCGIGLLGSWTYLSVHSLFDNLYVNNLFLHIGLMLAVTALLYNQIVNVHRAAQEML